MVFPNPTSSILRTLLVVLIALTAIANAQEPSAGKTVVFSAIGDSRGVVYRVNGRIETDPLRGLGKAVETYGDNTSIACLIDSRLPIEVLANAAAMAGKAGFRRVQTFALDHSSGKVAAVTVGAWTTAPGPQ